MSKADFIEPIVVHSMGKVGSSTIYQSLLEMPDRFEVYHTHVLNKESYNSVSKGRSSNELSGHLQHTSRLLQKYGNCLSSLKYVCLVREPVSRNMSGFFEQFRKFYERGVFTEDTTLENVVDFFFAEYSHRLPLDWFDREIRSVVGLDVFLHPFDTDLGYATYALDGGGSVIVICLESLDTEGSQAALREFLSLEELKLNKENLGHEKAYAKAYRLFRQSIEFSDSYLDQMVESRYARHFYSSEKRLELLNKYRSNGNMNLDGLEGAWKVAQIEARAREAEARLYHAEIRAEQAEVRAEGARAHYAILAEQAKAVKRSWSFKLGFYLLHPWRVFDKIRPASRNRVN